MASKQLEGDAGVPTLELSPEADAGPWVVEISGEAKRRTASLARGQRLTLGSRTGADLIVVDPTVSGLHAQLTGASGGVCVEDLRSKNGVHVGGARVERAVLSENSSFVVGRTRVVVRRRDERVTQVEPVIPGLIGSCPSMRRLAAEITRVARLDAPVLITGESGTGKDVVARALHRLSGRAGRYVALNAGALPEALADSELFGHRRGAFTGAVQAHVGAFEQADRGTLFLDEVADLAPSIQVKLLRAVEEGEIRQLGGVSPRQVHTRVIAATWASLPDLIQQGRFRADLYHRISTFVLSIPPLRQRRSDIAALCRCLFAEHERQLGRKHLSADALRCLSAYTFPGNVRELFSILYRAAAMCSGPEISALDIEAALPPSRGPGVCAGAAGARRILAAHSGNVSAAARSARVARSTFRSWLKRDAAAESGVLAPCIDQSSG